MKDAALVTIFSSIYTDELCATHLCLNSEATISESPTATWHGPTESLRKKTLLAESLISGNKNSTYELSMSKIPQRLLTGSQFGEVRQSYAHYGQISMIYLGNSK